MPPSVPPPMPPVIPRMPGGRVAAIPLGQALAGLFLNPVIIFSLQREGWWRALRVLVGVALICGLLVGCLRATRAYHEVLAWSTWLEQEVGTLRLDREQLLWKQPAELPYVTRHQGWRFDFVPPATPLPALSRLGPEERGFWISADRVICWRNSEALEQQVSVALFERGRFDMALSLNVLLGLAGEPLLLSSMFISGKVELQEFTQLFWPAGFNFGPGEFTAVAQCVLTRFLVPAYILLSAAGTIVCVLLCTSFFSLIPVLLRSPFAKGGLAQTFSFYAFASIPPLITASIYAALNLPFLDFANTFMFGLLAYLVLVTNLYRKAMGDKGDESPF